MRTAARHIILVTLLATVVCADRAVMALPAVNQTVTQVAGRVAARLAGNLGRTNREYRCVQCRGINAVREIAVWRPARLADLNHFALSASQYPLPPPAL